MRNRKSAALWNLIFSYANVGYAVISGLLLVPLYLRFISIELYGAWLASGNVLAWMTVVDPGLASVVGQRTAHAYGNNDKEGLVAYTQAGLLVTVGLVAFVFVASLTVSAYLPSLVKFQDLDQIKILRESFIIASGGVCLMLLSFSFGVVNRSMLGSVAHGVVALSGNLALIALTVVLLFLDFGLYALAWGLFARGGVALVGGAGYLIYRFVAERMSLRRDFSKVREILGLLSFTSLGKVGSMATTQVDAILVARFLGPEAVPIFVLTKRPFKIGQTFVSRIATSVGPSMSHLVGEGRQSRVRLILCRLLRINFWLLGLAFAGYIALIDSFISLWVGSEFFAGPGVALALCMLFAAEMLSITAGVYCAALGDIKGSSLAVFAFALLSLPLALAGVHFYGLLGLAGGPLFAYMAIYSWYFPRSMIRRGGLQREDVRGLFREFAKTIGISVFVALLFFGLSTATWLEFGFIVLALSITYFVLAAALSRDLRSELKAAVGLIRRIK